MVKCLRLLVIGPEMNGAPGVPVMKVIRAALRFDPAIRKDLEHLMGEIAVSVMCSKNYSVWNLVCLVIFQLWRKSEVVADRSVFKHSCIPGFSKEKPRHL